MSDLHPAVGIYTLGCKVNQYESEAIAEAFASRGFSVLSPTAVCDVYIINTCTVTAESDRKARQFIRRAIHKNPKAYLLVTGCLAQTDPAQIAAIEGVDFICGNHNKMAIVDAAVALLQGERKNSAPTILHDAPEANGFEPMQITRFDRTRAYVKIEDGCESKCTYCIIPEARGTIRSKPVQDVLAEVQALTENGCKEIVLTGIETASYGKDLKNTTLGELLLAVDRIPGVGRIRLGSLDPSLMKQSFVDHIAGLSSLAPHFHLSMQSGSDRILAAMKRKYNAKMAMEGMERLRRAIPDVQFTTDIIVGFPGETEADFEATVDFVRRAGFLMVHVFPYSKRKGTPAAIMPNQVPEEEKHRRVAALTKVQDEIRQRILCEQVGKTVPVLFETYKNGVAYGHTPSFIEVACPSPRPLQAVTACVHILSAKDSHCMGEILCPK
ncbi:MAG: tRNA (N(6)-L-threonylcarbamoyladenosine(37)-C(2))-methylthiotransferase MtaB [Clostridia bacterium]|nr:tRNA (N(6)-L-threonylcarbamoyladenosine(37)-C(2))-methylthiotransferase MtaB [Clostridia bacterium]